MVNQLEKFLCGSESCKKEENKKEIFIETKNEH